MQLIICCVLQHMQLILGVYCSMMQMLFAKWRLPNVALSKQVSQTLVPVV